MDEAAALEDLRSRIRNYERVYETVDERLEPDVAYIKVIDLREKIVCFRISGARAQAIVAFLMAVHVVHRPIWLVRAGHCVDTPLDDGKVLDDTRPGDPPTGPIAAGSLPSTNPPSLPGPAAEQARASQARGSSADSSASGGTGTGSGQPHGPGHSVHLQALEQDRRDRLLAPSPSMSPPLGG